GLHRRQEGGDLARPDGRGRLQADGDRLYRSPLWPRRRGKDGGRVEAPDAPDLVEDHVSPQAHLPGFLVRVTRRVRRGRPDRRPARSVAIPYFSDRADLYGRVRLCDLEEARV